MKWFRDALMAGRSFTYAMRDEAGSAGLMLGIALVPIMIAVGVALNHGSHTNVLSKLQAASDSAALAAAQNFDFSLEEMQSIAGQYFSNNFNTSAVNSASVSLTRTDDCITVHGQAAVESYFIKLVSSSENTLTATAEICRSNSSFNLDLSPESGAEVFGRYTLSPAYEGTIQ